METLRRATRAYETAREFRSQREQEADVFRRAIDRLVRARDANPVIRVRALADNRLLWITVNDLMRDPANSLPPSLRAAILSVGLAVQREMDKSNPDFGFLIDVNENICAGLSGHG